MQLLKMLGFCFVIAAGCGLVYSAQTSNQSVPADFLVRPMDVADAALTLRPEGIQLSDWEFTVRSTTPICRFIR